MSCGVGVEHEYFKEPKSFLSMSDDSSLFPKALKKITILFQMNSSKICHAINNWMLRWSRFWLDHHCCWHEFWFTNWYISLFFNYSWNIFLLFSSFFFLSFFVSLPSFLLSSLPSFLPSFLPLLYWLLPWFYNSIMPPESTLLFTVFPFQQLILLFNAEVI